MSRTNKVAAAEPKMTRGAIWKTFLNRLAENIGRDAVVVHPRPIVAWRDGKAFNRLQLVLYTAPDPRYPGNPPMVTRMALNVMMMFRPPKTLLRRLGFDSSNRPVVIDPPRLEWSVLGDELLAFADWLPLWVRGRLDQSVMIPLPPHPSHVWGRGLRTTDYAWTVAAWDAYSLWRRMDPRLPRGGIPAKELMPALPMAIAAD